MFFATPSAVAWCFILLFTLSPLGVNMGYHRLISHQAFECSKFFRNFLATLGVISGQGSPLLWISWHRIHHAYTDTPKDIHSPVNGGFWWSHMVHLCYRPDWASDAMWRGAIKDLNGDRYLEFLHKYAVPIMFTQVIPLYLLGGMPLLMWGGFARVLIMLHFTWCVNSVTHLWGYKNFTTKDTSTNNPFVALVTAGEGWHNNHHAFPRSAAHGLKWWEFDLTYLYIRVFKMVGLIRNVNVAKVPKSGPPSSQTGENTGNTGNDDVTGIAASPTPANSILDRSGPDAGNQADRDRQLQ